MRKLLANTDKTLLICMISMLIFGLLMIFSSSNTVATVRDNNPYLYLMKQGVFILAGTIAFLFVINVSTKYYYRLSKYILIILIGLLAFLIIFGQATRSVKGWIPIGPFTLQPSEFAKMAIIMFMGAHYEKVVARGKTDINSILKPLLYAAIVILFTLAQPDLGTALILIGITGVTLISIPLDKKIKEQIYTVATFGAFAVMFVGFIGIVVNNIDISSKTDRFNFLNPCDRYKESSGYQVCNGYIAINNGGLLGVGLGNSTQKYLYLPEAHTDFIFPVVVEEWGMVGGLSVLLVYAIILSRILLISKRSVSLRGSIIAYGIFVYIFLHIAINLSGVLGIAPLTGVPLPFLSYGGSSLLTLMIAMAIVQRVEIERNLKIKQNITKII